MEYVKNDEREYINTEERDLDMEWIEVENADGYGGCDITVGSHTMTWKQFDVLKAVMLEAEKRWRN
jgi:hypothetical protein